MRWQVPANLLGMGPMIIRGCVSQRVIGGDCGYCGVEVDRNPEERN